jgi:hypothetical protein
LLAGIVGHQVFGLTDAVALGAKPEYVLWITLGATIAAGWSAPNDQRREVLSS